jgi:hypothetical protein
MIYRESRAAGALPYLLLTTISIFALLMSVFGPVANWHGIATAAQISSVAMGMVAFVFVVLKIFKPREVLNIKAESIVVTGLRPGWWKLFQRWKTIEIPIGNIVSVEIGNIGNGLRAGKWHLSELDSSRNAVLQNVCVFRYEAEEKTQILYYPHTDTIKNFDQAVGELARTLVDKVERF